MPATSSPKASKIDILEVLTPLMRTMPTKGKVQDRMEGYFIALAQFTRADIEAGVRKFLSGQCAGVKAEFVPLPPQLAQIVRDVAGVEEAQRKVEEATKLSNYLRPSSKVIARNVTKDQVREGRGGGIYPPGCIWCPAPFGDNQDFGDLYGPDPSWRPARPLNAPPPMSGAPGEPERYFRRIEAQKMRDFSEPTQTYTPEAELLPPPTIHDYSKETTVDASPHLLKSLEEKQQMEDLILEKGPDYEPV